MLLWIYDKEFLLVKGIAEQAGAILLRKYVGILWLGGLEVKHICNWNLCYLFSLLINTCVSLVYLVLTYKVKGKFKNDFK